MPQTFDPTQPFTFVTPPTPPAPGGGIGINLSSHMGVPDALAAMHQRNQAQGTEAAQPGSDPDNPLAGLEPADAGNGNGGGLGSILNFSKNLLKTTIIPAMETVYAGFNPQAAVNMGVSMLSSQGAQIKKGWDAIQKAKRTGDAKDWMEAYAHTLGAAIPIMGPAAADAGEQIASGDVSGGLGAGAGLVLPFGVHPALKFAERSIPAGAADVLDRMGNRKLVRAIAPETGEQKTRFGNMAAKAAPDLLRDQVTTRTGEVVPTEAMNAWSKAALHDKVKTARSAAAADLDASYAAIPEKQRMSLKSIEDSLKAEIADLTPKGVKYGPGVAEKNVGASVAEDQWRMRPADGGQLETGPTKEVQSNRSRFPTSTEPVGVAAKLEALRTALGEIQALGDEAHPAELRKLATSWGSMAEREFTPATAPDFLKARGEGAGFAAAENSLRNAINKNYPELVAKNAKYSMFRAVDRVMSAAQEAEQVRPGAGRQARLAMHGAVVGEAVGYATGYPGVGSAAMGAALAPILDAASASGVTSQIGVARTLAKMADAIRARKGEQAEALLMNAAQTAGVKVTPGMLGKIRGLLTTPVGEVVNAATGQVKRLAKGESGSVPDSPAFSHSFTKRPDGTVEVSVNEGNIGLVTGFGNTEAEALSDAKEAIARNLGKFGGKRATDPAFQYLHRLTSPKR